ncbi:MAG: 23S rRNA (pseudouridine(1915)-N(3))-methyltransferase RlmH [Bacteroidota bacterium]
MTIKLLAIGKTDSAELRVLFKTYENRLKRYVPFEFEMLPDLKNRKVLTKEVQKEKEGQLLLQQIKPSDLVVVLDEKGNQFTSKAFSNYLQKRMNSGIKNLVFVIGGPYGFSPAVYERCNDQISLSKMTFSHQMIRLFAVEQLYRAYTILRNEPYHHE